MYTCFSDRERSIISVPETASTNNDIKDIIKKSGSPVFSAVTAERQTAGRGRLGRSFLSPVGGLYFSASYPLTGKEANIPFLTLLAGLAVNEAIRELTGINTLIKWPNDIYLNNKKLCGILTELVTFRGLTAIVGIGLNLTETDFPEEIRDIATSFAKEGISPPEKTELIKKITEILDRLVYEEYSLYNVNKNITAELKEKSYSLGKTVSYRLADESITGVVTDIRSTGAAVITLPDGTEKEIFCGESI
ncbi:MAG: biotin--[Clostridia bacterium]|nr:biotin--[acetyl-CoA-carboxylase] ligase [Clostridia bacterium]